MTFQVETWKDLRRDGESLFRVHWEDLAMDKSEIELSIDHARYDEMEAAKILHVLTARDDGKLVGYFVAFVLPHAHYNKAGLMAFTDFYYMSESARAGGAGAKLLIEAERTLRERGAVKAYLSCKVHQDHSPLFEKLGWRKTDFSFCKMLQKG